MADKINQLKQNEILNLKETKKDEKTREIEKAKEEARKKEIRETFNNLVEEKFTEKEYHKWKEENKEMLLRLSSYTNNKSLDEQIKENLRKQNEERMKEVKTDKSGAVILEGHKTDLKKELAALGLTREWQFLNYTQEDEPLLQSFFEALAVDVKQTSSWADLGVNEINPLLKPYTKGKGHNPMIPATMTATSALGLYLIGNVKDKGLRDVLLHLLAIGEGFVVTQNGRVYPEQHDRFGPVQPGQIAPGIYFRFHFKF